MRKPNYGQERAERERAKDAKARAKEQKKQATRDPRPGEAEGDAPREDEGAGAPPGKEGG